MRKLILVLATLISCVLLSMPVLADTIVTQYSLDGTNWTNGNAYTATSDTTLYYRTYNQTRGTASAAKSIRLLVDKKAPTQPIISYAKDNQWTNSPPVMQWSSRDTGGSGIAKYQYWRSDMVSWQDYGTGTNWTPEQNKDISIKWRAVDAAGNISPESRAIRVKTDNTQPVLTVYCTPKEWTRQAIMTVTATDASPVQYQLKRGNAVIADFGSVNRWQITENGEYTVIAKDAAGNTSNKAVTVSNIDRTPPNVTWHFGTDKPQNKAEITLNLWDDLSDVDFVILPDGTKWRPGDPQL